MDNILCFGITGPCIVEFSDNMPVRIEPLLHFRFKLIMHCGIIDKKVFYKIFAEGTVFSTNGTKPGEVSHMQSKVERKIQMQVVLYTKS